MRWGKWAGALVVFAGLVTIRCAPRQQVAPTDSPRASVSDPHGESFAIASLPPLPSAKAPPSSIPAKLFLPDRVAQLVPAMVIVVSSGCVYEGREPTYARALAAHGIAGLVVDSCTPRGVKSTVDDQSRLTGWEVENDAWAALIALAHDPRIDPKRIGIMGVSKGGGVALNTALLARRRWQRNRVPADLAFAAHVPMCPGCSARHRDAHTTGAPIFFMMGEADDYTPASECTAYIEALRAAGNARVEARVYEHASHAWEWLGAEPRLLANAENYSRCHAIIEDDGTITDTASGERVRGAEYLEWARVHCMFRGNTHSGGGTAELRARATDDLVAFLQRAFRI